MARTNPPEQLPDPAPTPKDLAIDVRAMLATMAEYARENEGKPRWARSFSEPWEQAVASLCRRLLAAEARIEDLEQAVRDYR